MGVPVKPGPIVGLPVKPGPVMGIPVKPGPVMGIPVKPGPGPITGIVIPPDHDHDHDHDHDWDHDHDYWWWHHFHRPVVIEEPVSSPVVSVPSSPGPCTCLTKTYLQDGSVMFKDVCTKEAAIATPDELRAQAQGN
jgi:hypothetical protein